jgi:hypothetical protein
MPTQIYAPIRVSDILATDTRIATFWTSEDGQHDLDMSGHTLGAAKTELLGQCGTDAQRSAILAGTIGVNAALVALEAAAE